MAPDLCHPKNTYMHGGRLAALPARPAPAAQHTCGAGQTPHSGRGRREHTASPGEVIGYLREHEITLTWNPAAAALQARATETAKTVTVKAS